MRFVSSGPNDLMSNNIDGEITQFWLVKVNAVFR